MVQVARHCLYNGHVASGFTPVFEEVSPSEGGGYIAYIVNLPGAISEGDTLEEARENLSDAVAILLALKGEA